VGFSAGGHQPQCHATRHTPHVTHPTPQVIAINIWFLVRGEGPGKFGAIGGVLCVLAMLWVAWVSVLLKRARSAVASLESKQTATFVEYVMPFHQ
jgi:hypothetical protein